MKLPEFENPPVIEVVCGLMFDPLGGLLAPHLGLLWQRFREEYPKCQEVPPLAPVVELFEGEPSIGLELSETPPLPRIWFTRADDVGIIQVQRDRFLHNWKKAKPGDAYPRYGTVFSLFKDKLAIFEQFISDEGLGPVRPRQYELTYVNHIPKGKLVSSLLNISVLFPDFSWRADAGRFLACPDGLNWRTSFVLPEHRGRLHVAIRSGVRRDDHETIILLELTARGMAGVPDREQMWAWFDMAHEWIVCAFTDLTSPRAHSAWRRTQ